MTGSGRTATVTFSGRDPTQLDGRCTACATQSASRSCVSWLSECILTGQSKGMDITDLPAHALSSAILKRQVSCREVMRATLARIESVNAVHNAIVSLRDGDVLLGEVDERYGHVKGGDRPVWQIVWM